MSVCIICAVPFIVMQGVWESGKHLRWGRLTWQSESPEDLHRVHRVATRRIQFDPQSVPAALGDLTNRASGLNDTDTIAASRCGDVGQAVQGSVQGHGQLFRFRHSGGDNLRPFRANYVQLGGRAFV